MILDSILNAKKVRYAVVSLGDITQEAMLPGIAHTGNSELVALVSGTPDKAEAVGALYGIAPEHRYSYDRFGELLASGTVDAVYLATPNWRHAEFAVPALKAGVHVLLEKPMEVSRAKCREILQAAEGSTARLMIAYRLHFEPATLAAIELIRSGELGEVRLFSSTFSQMIDPANHRALSGEGAGVVLDMGTYAVNACRYVFGDEPTEVASAVATRRPEAGLGEGVDDTVAVTLRFPGGKLAHFVVSYFGSTLDSYTAVGTKGSVEVNPGYMYGKSLEHKVIVGGSPSTKSFKNTDHFGGEMKYFSQCILDGAEIEPDGEEGYADVRVLEGILEAVRTGGPVKLEPFTRTKRIDTEAQLQTLAAQKPPEVFGASNPSRDMDVAPKN